MRIEIDGVGMVPSFCEVNEFVTEGNIAWVLEEPYYLRNGDRVLMTDEGATVEDSTGERYVLPGSWQFRCGLMQAWEPGGEPTGPDDVEPIQTGSDDAWSLTWADGRQGTAADGA
ncbi:hypothetical protein [Yinghuangia soli]|uniref:Uncharacterized protein n=1 Tax=Yinghuangia soli TaxID=2908204 RepID=A0AA41U9P9_9ACTN|nr:hypothetical protein [Yinghuangia soli]MCF2534059.1 hypothetical protein [Yinghuangia soli]